MINLWNNNQGAKKARGNSIMIKDSIKSFSILFPKCIMSVAAEQMCVCTWCAFILLGVKKGEEWLSCGLAFVFCGEMAS